MFILVTRRGTLLMETGLLHDYFGNLSMRGERYYFCVEGSTQGEIESMQDEIEMNLRNRRWGEIEMNIGKLGNSEGWRRVLDLHKSGNEFI